MYGIFVARPDKEQRICENLTFGAGIKHWDQPAPETDWEAEDQARKFAARINARAKQFPPAGPKAYVKRLAR